MRALDVRADYTLTRIRLRFVRMLLLATNSFVNATIIISIRRLGDITRQPKPSANFALISNELGRRQSCLWHSERENSPTRLDAMPCAVSFPRFETTPVDAFSRDHCTSPGANG